MRSKTPWYVGDDALIEKKITAAPAALRPYIQSFCKEGYVAIPNAVAAHRCDDARAAFSEFTRRHAHRMHEFANAQGFYSRLINMHLAIPELLACFAQNKALGILHYLFDALPSLYTSLYFQRGSVQPIHRDSPFFATKPANYYLGFWTALEDATAHNGALSVVPGAHRLAPIDVRAVANQKYTNPHDIPGADMQLWDGYQAQVAHQITQAGMRPQTIKAAKGTTIIWHPRLPHGGGPVTDPNLSRNSLVVHTTPAGVPVYHHDVFFNPDNTRPDQSDARYWAFDDHYVQYHEMIDIEHKLQIPISELN